MMSLWEKMMQHGRMTEADGIVAYAMITVLTRFGFETKALVTHMAQLIPVEQTPAVEAEIKTIIEALLAVPTNGLPTLLINEKGMPGVGVEIWRRGEKPGSMWQGTVGEFLIRPDYQSGTWLIDGGWGGPPGPIEVDWIDGAWVNQGYLGIRR